MPMVRPKLRGEQEDICSREGTFLRNRKLGLWKIGSVGVRAGCFVGVPARG
jgi:hypothetical protein